MKINVIEYLIETAARVPDKIALEDRAGTITFARLVADARAVSGAILRERAFTRRPIGIFLPKSIDAICALAGTLFSGNIYVPLDVKSPRERIHAILENIAPELIITDAAHAPVLAEMFPQERILLIAEARTAVPANGFETLIDTDPAYIINTSGSTGTPKGVTIAHRSVIDYIEWARACYNVCESDVMANQAPLHFDNSVLDLYLCFATGLTLILTPEELFSFPIRLLEFFAEKRVNTVFFVPSVLVNIANLGLLEKIRPPLERILFAGEVMPTKQLNVWRRYYPNAVFSNLYGPTEICVDCTFYTLDRDFRDDEPLPIGKPCRNSDVMILDEQNRRVRAPGVSGELCVRGTSLALGYWNDPARTDAAFVQNPENKNFSEKIYRTGDIVHLNERGEIIFEGRRDFQIKHLGYRIELGEIETALGRVPALENVCVSYDRARSRIVLFYEAQREIPPRELLLELGKSLPKYMIPTELRRLEKLPQNANGKIDRKALSALLENGK